MAEFVLVRLEEETRDTDYTMDCIRGIRGVADVDYMPSLHRLIERLKGAVRDFEEIRDRVLVEKQ